jgi:hypothetical protein
MDVQGISLSTTCSLQCKRAGYTFLLMPECGTVWHLISPVPEWTKTLLLEPVRYLYKRTQSGTGNALVPDWDTGCPMPSIANRPFKGTVQRDGSSCDRPSLKSEARRFLEKSARVPYYESLLKLQRHLVWLLAIRKQIANGAHRSVSGLFSTTYSCWQLCYEQIWNLYATAQWTF